MLLLSEGDEELRSENQITFATPADPNCPDSAQRGKTWLTRKAHGMYLVHPRDLSTPTFQPIVLRLTTEMMNAQTSRGGDIPQAFQLIDHGLWDHPAMDPNSCGVVIIFAPIGPWTHSEYPCPVAFSFACILQCLRYVN